MSGPERLAAVCVVVSGLLVGLRMILLHLSHEAAAGRLSDDAAKRILGAASGELSSVRAQLESLAATVRGHAERLVHLDNRTQR